MAGAASPPSARSSPELDAGQEVLLKGIPGPLLRCETLSLSNQWIEFTCVLICRHSLL